MDAPLKEQFIIITMRFKRLDICPPTAAGLQPSELAVLKRASAGCTCGEKGLSVSAIQQNLPLSKPAVSQTLNNLEKKDYITRTIDPQDRRKITVSLTPTGEQVLENAQRCYEESLENLLERLGTENTQTLIKLLDHLMAILDEI